jgi:hypothetical protein
MQSVMETLSDGFSLHWIHLPEYHGHPFLKVLADIPAPSEAVNIDEALGFISGELECGTDNETGNACFAGFSASVSIGFGYPSAGARITNARGVWSKHYPCAHVPLVVPANLETPQTFTQTIEFPGHDIPFEMPPGFQFAPGFELVDGFPRWVGGGDERGEPVELDADDVGEKSGIRIENVRIMGWAPAPPS